MSDELKPYPFCGSEAVNNSKSPERINCSASWCYMGEPWREYGLTVEDWNTHPVEDALTAELDLVREVLRKGDEMSEQTTEEIIINALRAEVRQRKGMNEVMGNELDKKNDEIAKLIAELEQAREALRKQTAYTIEVIAERDATNRICGEQILEMQEALNRLEFAASMYRSRDVNNRDDWQEAYPDYADWEHGDIDEELCQAIDQARAVLSWSER